MSPFKKGVLSLLILVLSALPSQGNEVMFSPVIRNFTPSDYHGGRQNRSVSQSASGLIYVGNNQYLLEYDGHSWNRYLMPNKGIVRSVLADPDGKIYCGSSQEFGYFVKSGNSLIFRSLSDGLKEMNILIITYGTAPLWALAFPTKNTYCGFASQQNLRIPRA